MRFLSLFLVLILLSCSQSKKSLNDGTITTYEVSPYYFPLEDLKTPKVYVYVNNRTNKKDYWKMWFDPDSKTFHSEIYFGGLNMVEYSIENIGPKGASFKEYWTIQDGERIKKEVIKDQIFNWNIKSNEQLVWHTKTQSVNFNSEVIKKRKIENFAYKVNIGDSTFETCVFRDDYEVTETIDGQTSTYLFEQITYYGLGIGIVEYKREFDDGTNFTMTLIDILSTEEFEELKTSNSN